VILQYDEVAAVRFGQLIAADFIRDQDIPVVSQRGTMFSEPALTGATRRRIRRKFLDM
jgi:hypothetical protein